ncbi:MAG: PqqD family protein [Blastomonas sp.]
MARYRLNNPPVICEIVEGEVIAINLDSGVYHSLRGDAAAVWSAIIAGCDGETILAASLSPADAAQGALDAFVERLKSLDLIVEDQTDDTPPSPDIAGWNADGLGFESYEDMTDLLGLDPVHEADLEAGWPVAAAG